MQRSEASDFYRQLALLLKSNLPLPESLRQLAAGLERGDFKHTLDRVAQTTESGAPLSKAMRRYPHWFQPAHVRMIESGEASGTLPETLVEVARMAHADHQIVAMLRGIAAYPVFVVFFALIVLIGVYTFVVPEFRWAFVELGPWGRMPSVTRLSFWLSDILRAHIKGVAIGLLIGMAVACWLIGSGSPAATKRLLSIVQRMPGAGAIFRNLSMARICSLWSVMARQRVPAHEAFETIAGMAVNRRLAAAMQSIAARLARGEALTDSLRSQPIVSPLLALTFEHTPETELPAELNVLADLYRDRAATSIRHAAGVWEVILVLVMVAWVSLVVISMYMPLVQIIRMLSY